MAWPHLPKEEPFLEPYQGAVEIDCRKFHYHFRACTNFYGLQNAICGIDSVLSKEPTA
jgi:hypothetical protein